MGRDVRETESVLLGVGATDAAPSDPHRPTTVLGHLQDDIGANRAPALCGRGRRVQVHACHGPARQVEVLREVILGCWQTTPISSRATSW